MVNVRAFVVRNLNLLNFQGLTRCNELSTVRQYSVYPRYYLPPIYRKDEIEALHETDKAKEIAHIPIKPAFTSHSSSEFHDKLVTKFTHYVMRKGQKELARILMAKAFEQIKMIQLERYNSAPPGKKDSIELDPKVILHRAVENCKPVLQLLPVRKGGILYQVPAPLEERRAMFLSMNWLIQASKEKDRNARFSDVLAKELIDAANNEGRVILKKQELHRQCEANRAYAHFRW